MLQNNNTRFCKNLFTKFFGLKFLLSLDLTEHISLIFGSLLADTTTVKITIKACRTLLKLDCTLQKGTVVQMINLRKLMCSHRIWPINYTFC